MANSFLETRVSIVLLFREPLPYDRGAFVTTLQSVVAQDLRPHEILIVDDRGPDARPDFADGDLVAKVRHLPGTYANRAAMLNAALQAATGDYILLVLNDQAAVTLRQSAVQTLVMAATRHAARGSAAATRHLRPVGFVYADYDRVDSAGQKREVHLLDWHPGRLRETTDFGAAFLFPTQVLRTLGGFSTEYGAAADWYDLRLRATERHDAVHIANRYAGGLYSVAAAGAGHNVFAYLLADKQTQLELERACTAHLERVGARLAPGVHVGSLEYTTAENEAFRNCLASIVTPVNQRPEFIGRAIESVQAQTIQQVEMIVVVNGGPADPTADEVRRYMPGGDRHQPDKPPVRLIVVDVNNLGLCLNTGIAAARGKFYVQLDSDDRLKPDAVEKLLAVFQADPTVGMVVGSYEVWTLDAQSGALHRNAEIPVVTHDEWTADNGRNNLLRINGAGAPRAAHVKAIAAAGWFGVNDTAQCRNYGEDYDLVLRISERFTIGRVWEPIYEVIRHSGGTDHAIDQTTIDRNDNAKDHMRLEALHRRQALGAKSS
ncbi:MAG: glycosyltransferase [Phycisphaerales bacterium]|nr:glycosyltransferase [Phycisphaerales bacterium]